MSDSVPTPSSTPASTPATPAPSSTAQRRWPRRLLIAVLAIAVLLGGALWLLGRESTFQLLVQKVSSASGGHIAIGDVSGSLYGNMHISRLDYRGASSNISALDIDINWSPLQFFSNGITVKKLHAASLSVESFDPSTPTPALLPETLAPPFQLAINDLQLGKLTLISSGAETTAETTTETTAEAASAAPTVIEHLRLRLHGDADGWRLQDASAATPWGLAQIDASIAADRPFALDAKASLIQNPAPTDATAAAATGAAAKSAAKNDAESAAKSGPALAQLSLTARGNLSLLELNVNARSGAARGDARLTLAPYDPIILRDAQINGRGIDPSLFNPAWPQADLRLQLSAAITPEQAISGTLALTNHGTPGALDLQRLPFRSLNAQLAGTLSATRIEQINLDLAQAGQVSGAATIARAGFDAPVATANVKLQATDIDLKAIMGTLSATQIAGPIELTSDGTIEKLKATLADKGLRLDLGATLDAAQVTIQQARLSAGNGSISVTGQAALDQLQAFTLTASALRFNPAALGQYPLGNLNGDLTLTGQVLPQWQVGAKLTLRPSRLLNQPLSGSARLQADATHVHGIDASLALGNNTLTLAGAFGAPDEKLTWRAAAPQLSTIQSNLAGALTANGIVEGTIAAPRSSFELSARGLGMAAGQKSRMESKGAASKVAVSKVAASNSVGKDSVLQASGNVALNGAEVALKLNGSARRFNPAAFGPYANGNINGNFDGAVALGAIWKVTLDLMLQESTLLNAPLSGHARLTADAKRISSADVDLRLGQNGVQATGSFGAARDQLDWKLDAPQLATLGPQFGGMLRGSGMLGGTLAAPTMNLSVDGNNLRLPGKHRVKTLRASANLGAGGNDATLVTDIEISDVTSPALTLRSARVQSMGSRAAHQLTASASNDDFDANVQVRGAFSASGWRGTLDTLRNRGRQAFALQAPVPVQVTGPANGGLAGLLQPERLSVGSAVLTLAGGNITLQQLEKNGPLWTTSGQATGIALTYLAPPALLDTVRGDLTLGAAWSLKLQALPGKNDMTGMLRVFREKGDILVGGGNAGVPVALGLRTLDARADVQGNALRLQANIDGARAGTAKLDASTQLVQGRIAPDSVLRATASATLPSLAALAPLVGQPGLDLGGTLALALSAGGTIAAPALSGNIAGEKLMVSWAEHGIKLNNGQLQAALAGDQLLLQRLRFEGGKGSAEAEGWLRFTNAEASMQIKLVADKLQVLGRPDRTLIVSGSSTLSRDLKSFQFNGKFKADRAAIELASQDTPTISDDVVVLGKAGTKARAPGLPLNLDVEIDLGDAFRLQGFGLDTRLAGNLRVRAIENRPPTVLGSIRVERGTYAAYGQKLSIERGVISFSGAYDNPGLNILAVRKRPEGTSLTETNVEAGVEIRGTALSPVAKLVSTPLVPDSEKLSWLVLGHGTEGGGSPAGLLAGAAGALFGGGQSGSLQDKVAGTLGLDSIGLGQASATATGVESTVLTLGKRISRRAFLTFEQGVGTASSLVKLRYRLNERISLQFQTGANSAFDVLYTWAFD